ncbi:MAG: 6,7-dimethyl-8-ribityllumazine synthase [Pseudomonadota bacterium]
MAKNKRSALQIAVIEARYYAEISDELLAGAEQVLQKHDAKYDIFQVPGALEIPAAIAMAVGSQEVFDEHHYDGFIALGCVIRGETSHYDIVAEESARGLQDLAVSYALAIGNGILTVENSSQAWARANRTRANKGGFAADACITMIGLQRRFLG